MIDEPAPGPAEPGSLHAQEQTAPEPERNAGSQPVLEYEAVTRTLLDPVGYVRLSTGLLVAASVSPTPRIGATIRVRLGEGGMFERVPAADTLPTPPDDHDVRRDRLAALREVPPGQPTPEPIEVPDDAQTESMPTTDADAKIASTDRRAGMPTEVRELPADLPSDPAPPAPDPTFDQPTGRSAREWIMAKVARPKPLRVAMYLIDSSLLRDELHGLVSQSIVDDAKDAGYTAMAYWVLSEANPEPHGGGRWPDRAVSTDRMFGPIDGRIFRPPTSLPNKYSPWEVAARSETHLQHYMARHSPGECSAEIVLVRGQQLHELAKSDGPIPHRNIMPEQQGDPHE